jgi:hypothetical protein
MHFVPCAACSVNRDWDAIQTGVLSIPRAFCDLRVSGFIVRRCGDVRFDRGWRELASPCN